MSRRIAHFMLVVNSIGALVNAHLGLWHLFWWNVAAIPTALLILWRGDMGMGRS